MLVNHTKKYIFIHVPKCGGTTVQETLLKHSIFSNEEFEMYEFHTSLLSSIGQKYLSLGYQPIVFVRDPYSRFLSSISYIKRITNYYEDVYDIIHEMKCFKYPILTNPSHFFTGPLKRVKVYKFENFRESIINLLDTLGYPRVWWSRNRVAAPSECLDANIVQFVTEFYYKDFLDFKYPMKVAVCPFSHQVPYFESKFKYDWKEVRDKPKDIYFWAMKSVYDQEQDPRDSKLITFPEAAEPEPPQ